MMNVQNLYEARICADDKLIATVTGNDMDQLQITLLCKCELEKSGAVGEIIELKTGKVVYQCRKQSIIGE